MAKTRSGTNVANASSRSAGGRSSVDRTWRDRDRTRKEFNYKGVRSDEYRKASSERMKALWADPEWRAARIADIKKAWQQPHRRKPEYTSLGIGWGRRRTEAEAAWERVDRQARLAIDLATDGNGRIDNQKVLMGLLVAKGLGRKRIEKLMAGPKDQLIAAVLR